MARVCACCSKVFPLAMTPVYTPSLVVSDNAVSPLSRRLKSSWQLNLGVLHWVVNNLTGCSEQERSSLQIQMETLFFRLQRSPLWKLPTRYNTADRPMHTNSKRESVRLPVGVVPSLYKIWNGNCGLDENTEIPVSGISHTVCVSGLDFKQQVTVPRATSASKRSQVKIKKKDSTCLREPERGWVTLDIWEAGIWATGFLPAERLLTK